MIIPKVVYRNLREEEENAVLELWVSIFRDDRSARKQVFEDFHADPNRFSRTKVAVDQYGNLISAASYWRRSIRDQHGMPQPTGHVWGVATHPKARRQGHARQLLKQLSDSMRAEGCVWSILFAQDEARSLYLESGWQSIPARFRGGLLSNESIHPLGTYSVRTYDPIKDLSGWEPIAKVYRSYNAARLLTSVRDDRYWTGYINWMYTDWHLHHHAKILIAQKKEIAADVVGYALVHYYDAQYAKTNFDSPPWFYISEIGALAHEDAALLSILIAVSKEAKEKGLGYGQMALPNDLVINRSLERIFKSPLENMENEGTAMIKALSPRMEKDLDLSKSSPDAWIWENDRF